MVETSEYDDFFAPSQYDAFDHLIDEYRRGSEKLLEVHNTISDGGLLPYLVDTHSRLLSTDDMLTKYRSYMWHSAMRLTDVMDFMPTELRDAWSTLIETGNGTQLTPRLQLDSGFIADINNPIKFDGVPEFTEEGVRTTIGTLMCMRNTFLTSMVDGVFFHLSGEHVTNRPEGFSKRFIINNVYSQDYFGVNFPMYSKVGYVHDLRFVIGKLLRRNPIVYQFSNGNTDDVIRSVIEQVGYGQWCWIDGNAIRMRCYKKGTVHIELHEDLTWMLNGILANRHPNAIPAKFTKKPERMRKDHTLIHHVIDEHVVRVMYKHTWDESTNTITFSYGQCDKWVDRELDRLMSLIGGVRINSYSHSYRFSYDPTKVVQTMVTNRVVPDQKSHQFYPSPDVVVDVVCDAVRGLDNIATVCEPSCGTGNILAGLSCNGLSTYTLSGYEISDVLAKVASQRVPEANISCCDFLDITGVRIDAIAMNPPFDQGRWMFHVKHALGLSDRVVAVLPAGADCESVCNDCGCNAEVVNTLENAFDDTSITVKVVLFSR